MVRSSTSSSTYHCTGFVGVDCLNGEGVSREGRAAECFEHLDRVKRRGGGRGEGEQRKGKKRK